MTRSKRKQRDKKANKSKKTKYEDDLYDYDVNDQGDTMRVVRALGARKLRRKLLKLKPECKSRPLSTVSTL
ncbi:hypothetical protein BsWGS_00479 [Bradybaena similaris]